MRGWGVIPFRTHCLLSAAQLGRPKILVKLGMNSQRWGVTKNYTRVTMVTGVTWLIRVASVARAERPYSRACLKFEFMTQRLTRVGSRDASGSENLQPPSHIC